MRPRTSPRSDPVATDPRTSLPLRPYSQLDRFIPSRCNLDTDHALFQLGQENQGSPRRGADAAADKSPAKAEYQKLLAASLNVNEQARVLAFKHKAPAPPEGHDSGLASLYSANLGQAPSRKQFRHVPTTQERILDAPDLVDDYYLNLLDWSSNNVVGGRGPLMRRTWASVLHRLSSMQQARRVSKGTQDMHTAVLMIDAAADLPGHAGGPIVFVQPPHQTPRLRPTS
jgi:hypothetical protein